MLSADELVNIARGNQAHASCLTKVTVTLTYIPKSHHHSNTMALDCFIDPAELEVNSDISGPGRPPPAQKRSSQAVKLSVLPQLITGFLGTGFFTMTLISAYYVFVYNSLASLPDDDGSNFNFSPYGRHSEANPIDYCLLQPFRDFSGRRYRVNLPIADRNKLERAFSKV